MLSVARPRYGGVRSKKNGRSKSNIFGKYSGREKRGEHVPSSKPKIPSSFELKNIIGPIKKVADLFLRF